MEMQAVRFYENEMVKNALKHGSYGIELWQDEEDPTLFIGTGIWDSLEDANRFQAQWESELDELRKFCVKEPTRAVYKIHRVW